MNFFQGEVARRDSGLAFRNANMNLSLPATQLRNVAGEVILGVRPEAITICPKGGSEGDLDGAVSLVTVVQPNVYVTVRVGSHDAMARLPDGVGWPRPGDTVDLEVNRGKLHFFHAESGERLGGAMAGRLAG